MTNFTASHMPGRLKSTKDAKNSKDAKDAKDAKDTSSPEPTPAQEPEPAQEPAAQAEPEPEPREDVPIGTSAEIIAWVGGDKDRAQRALDTEKRNPTPRKSVVYPLEKLLAKKENVE